jgi:hypothetical protein
MSLQLSNTQITEALNPDVSWRMAYPFVEGAVRAILDAWPADAPRLSTTALVDKLYDPSGLVDTRVRSRIFKALKACADHGLKPYVILGEPTKVGNVENARRMLWGAPVKSGTYCCPQCGRPL